MASKKQNKEQNKKHGWTKIGLAIGLGISAPIAVIIPSLQATGYIGSVHLNEKIHPMGNPKFSINKKHSYKINHFVVQTANRELDILFDELVNSKELDWNNATIQLNNMENGVHDGLLGKGASENAMTMFLQVSDFSKERDTINISFILNKKTQVGTIYTMVIPTQNPMYHELYLSSEKAWKNVNRFISDDKSRVSYSQYDLFSALKDESQINPQKDNWVITDNILKIIVEQYSDMRLA